MPRRPTLEEWDDLLGSEEKVNEPRKIKHTRRRKRRQPRSDKNLEGVTNDGEPVSWKVHAMWSVAVLAVGAMFLATVRVQNYDTTTTGTVGRAGFLDEYEKAGFPTVAHPLDSAILSKSLNHLANVTDLPRRPSDVPLFFHIPRSGGSTIKDILGSCYGMVEATDVGARSGHNLDKELKVVLNEQGSSFVNVDTSTPEGIHRAKQMGLVESELASVIVTQHLYPAATLFNEDQRGRVFTMIRNPIERAVSLFHYLGVAHWEPTYDPDLSFISIEMYARSKRVEHNWMVRFLSNEMERDLTETHLAIAMEVLRRHCLVGLLEQKSESFARIEKYFGWSPKTTGERDCRDQLIQWGWSNKHAHPEVEEGSVVWELLYKKNSLDMELFQYARFLFDQQANMFQM